MLIRFQEAGCKPVEVEFTELKDAGQWARARYQRMLDEGKRRSDVLKMDIIRHGKKIGTISGNGRCLHNDGTEMVL